MTATLGALSVFFQSGCAYLAPLDHFEGRATQGERLRRLDPSYKSPEPIHHEKIVETDIFTRLPIYEKPSMGKTIFYCAKEYIKVNFKKDELPRIAMDKGEKVEKEVRKYTEFTLYEWKIDLKFDTNKAGISLSKDF